MSHAARDAVHCAVCPEVDDLEGVVVAGQELHLCREHARRLGSVSPASFADLAAFFAELGSDRRHDSDRRREQRRMFPRPETRRHDDGRRSGDPDP